MNGYKFVGRKYPYPIPYGAPIKVVKFYPRRKVLIEYNGILILTMTYNLRKIPNTPNTLKNKKGETT